MITCRFVLAIVAVLVTLMALHTIQARAAPRETRYESSGRQVLRPVARCPEGDLSCTVRGLWVEPSREHTIIRRKPLGKMIEKTFLLTGSLNGGEVRHITLRFVQERSDYFADTPHSGPVAEYGGSPGELTILTDRGPLRITTFGVRTERLPSLVIVDEKREQVVARQYIAGHRCPDLAFLARKRLIAVWDDGGRRCVAPRTTRSGLRRITANCAQPRTGNCGIPQSFQPAPMTVKRLNTMIRDLRPLMLWNNTPNEFGGNGWRVNSYRIPSKGLLIVVGRCTDDCAD